MIHEDSSVNKVLETGRDHLENKTASWSPEREAFRHWQELERLKKSEFPICISQVKAAIAHCNSWLRRFGAELDEERESEKVLKEYFSQRRCIDVGDFYGQFPRETLIHGLPTSKDTSGRNVQMQNNLVIPEEGKGFTITDFFRYISQNKPTLSCSSINQNSFYSAFFSPVGIIIEDGRILDASPEDMSSISFTNEMRVAYNNLALGSKHLEDRIKMAVSRSVSWEHNGRPELNEFIVENPSIDGVYFAPEKFRSRRFSEGIKQEIADFLRFAGKDTVYLFKEGEGFKPAEAEKATFEYLLS